MRDLIERLEKATGPDRDLDAEIYCLIHSDRIRHDALPLGYTISDLGNARSNRQLALSPYITHKRGPAPKFTASLDAALTTVPEGIAIDIRVYTSGRGSATLWNDDICLRRIDGATPAIAVDIAALKAREVNNG